MNVTHLSAPATINGKEVFDLLRDDLVALEDEFGRDTVSNVGAITEIGEYLMDALRAVDKIAYVRFASVYRDFQDEQAFLNELRSLTRQRLAP